MTGILPAVYFDGVIDVSHNNGAIDWPTVAGTGVAFAFIKATQGMSFVDPAFEHNRIGALNAGIGAIPYHFIDDVDPAAQAHHFIVATGLGPDMPAMLDWETSAPTSTLVAIGKEIEFRTGGGPICYYGYAQLAAPDPDLSRWPLMLPEYPHGTAPGDYARLVTKPPRLPPGRDASRPYDFHQYTPAGRIPGIAGPVDRSIWVGTRAELLAWMGSRPATAAQTTPAPVAPSRALRLGTEGPDVGALQRALSARGFPVAVDGVFGPQTDAAVRSFQRGVLLAADGVAGPLTLAALAVRE